MIGVDHFFLYVDYATEQTRAALKPYATESSDPAGAAPVATVVNWLDVVDRSLDSLSMTESNEAAAAAHKALGHDHVWFSQTMPFMRLQVKFAKQNKQKKFRARNCLPKCYFPKFIRIVAFDHVLVVLV